MVDTPAGRLLDRADGGQRSQSRAPEGLLLVNRSDGSWRRVAGRGPHRSPQTPSDFEPLCRRDGGDGRHLDSHQSGPQSSARADLRTVLADRRLRVTCVAILVTALVFSGLVTASLGSLPEGPLWPPDCRPRRRPGSHHCHRHLAWFALATALAAVRLPLRPPWPHPGRKRGSYDGRARTARARIHSLDLADSGGGPRGLRRFQDAHRLHPTADDFAPPAPRDAVLGAYAIFLDLGSALCPLIGLSFANIAALHGLYRGAVVLLLVAVLSFWNAFRQGTL